MTERERVVCRSCGEWGYEAEDDPCPGLCALCFDAGLALETVALDADADDPTLTLEDMFRRHGERLRALGMPPHHVDEVVRLERVALEARVS